MQSPNVRWPLLVGVLVVLLTASACFQAWEGDIVRATDSAQFAPTYTPPPTNTLFPSATPPPSITPPSLSASEPQEDVLALLTPDPGPIAQLPTFDPSLITLTVMAMTQAAQQNLDPFALTATAWINQATATALAGSGAPAGITGIVAVTPTSPFGAQPQFPQTSATLVPGADCVHEVRATDRNLFRIAQNYGLTVQDLSRANNLLNPDLIYVGDTLVIPGCGTTGVTPLPTSTPRVGATAVPPVPITAGGQSAPIAVTFTPIPSGQVVPGGASSGGQTHVVRQGETLYQISVRYGVSVHDIAAVNGLPNLNLIYIGQQLTIP